MQPLGFHAKNHCVLLYISVYVSLFSILLYIYIYLYLYNMWIMKVEKRGTPSLKSIDS